MSNPKDIREDIHARLDRDQLCDVAEHGANAGWPGFTYYTQTVVFHDLHEDEIWDWLAEDARAWGGSILGFLATFRGAKNVGSMAQFKNLLAWYALERVAHEELERA